MRRTAHRLAVKEPRRSVAPALASVNQAPKNRVGSTLADQSTCPECHHVRARARNAVTQGVPLLIHPAEGPAPRPKPHVGAAHSTSPTAYGAAVSTPPVRVLPDQPASSPSRTPSASGAVVVQPSA